MTETTDNNGGHGWVFIDGNCPLCVSTANRLAPLFNRVGLNIATQQTPWVRERLGLKEGEPLTEVYVLSAKGTLVGGADAVMHVARQIWWAWPLYLLSRLPGAMFILSTIYRRIAANRFCISNMCHRPRRTGGDWIPVTFVPLLAYFLAKDSARWILMWAIAFSIYAGFKWLTWRRASRVVAAHWTRHIQYLLCWPGMDAARFLQKRKPAVRSTSDHWVWAALRATTGCAMVWLASRLDFQEQWVIGWTGMIGLVLVLHFGLFELLACYFRSRGVQAQSIMCRPVTSTSLSEFWGRRWNTAFNHLAHSFVFRPATRRFGPRLAMFAAFLASGLIHDLVISVPAGAGYGQPTIYFVMQALGVLVQKTRAARRCRIDRGIVGWAFTLFVVLAPINLVLHPPFVVEVIFPFIESLRGS